jgi:hypothetical protein
LRDTFSSIVFCVIHLPHPIIFIEYLEYEKKASESFSA